MKLSRRDALAALAGLSAAGGSAAVGSLATRDPPVSSEGTAVDDGPVAEEVGDDDARSVLVAAAEVLYPSAVDGHRVFVETYLAGRRRRDPDHYESVVSVATELDAVARDWYDEPFEQLGTDTRDRLLRELGVDVADPDPDGNLSDRLRFFVVNDLLYALYTSPTGGKLVGTENPAGYPGGTTSYQRGPQGADDG